MPQTLERVRAIAFAGELQTAIAESAEAWGRALPPCPGHGHPLVAAVSNGVAVWQCPRDPEYHRVPILAG